MPDEVNDDHESRIPSAPGRASPHPRTVPATTKADRGTRKYGAAIEKALASFDPHQQEWADYIAFLARLWKAIQSVKQTDSIPHASLVSLRLAQCLKPSLPSGVHQKALEVYRSIFGLLGEDLAKELPVFLPGLLPVLSFASLTVRPLFYMLFEENIFKLDAQALTAPLKAMILSLLPGIEDETSEDFDRGLQALDTLRSRSRVEDHSALSDASIPPDSLFWQSFFLAAMAGSSKRMGALIFLVRRLPRLGTSSSAAAGTISNGEAQISEEAAAVVKPDAGLLLRCFAAGLRDPNVLVQRGFLDLLVTHLPIHTPLLQNAPEADLALVISTAITVVHRRDISLNRRLWSWFLGPEGTSAEQSDDTEKKPADDEQDQHSSAQIAYFQQFGVRPLERCILKSFMRNVSDANSTALMFRTCAALMDRWEIGGYLVPLVLIPALKAAQSFDRLPKSAEVNLVLKSANLFFDGIESSLIWSQLINELDASLTAAADSATSAVDGLEFLQFIISNFNIRDEDMLTIHIPQAAFVALQGLLELVSDKSRSIDSAVQDLLLEVGLNLVILLPERALSTIQTNGTLVGHSADTISLEQCSAIAKTIRKDSRNFDQMLVTPTSAVTSPRLVTLLRNTLSILYGHYLDNVAHHEHIVKCGELLLLLSGRASDADGLRIELIFQSMKHALAQSVQEWDTASGAFATTASIVSVKCAMDDLSRRDFQEVLQDSIYSLALQHLWLLLSPSSPKNHVEVVRLMWNVQKGAAKSNAGGRIDAFVTQRLLQESTTAHDLQRFMAFWDITLRNIHGRSDRKGSASIRRASSFASTIDISSPEVESLLSRPLHLLLDLLDHGDNGQKLLISAWLGHLSSIDRVISGLLNQLEQYTIPKQEKHASTARGGRSGEQNLASLSAVVRRLTAILAHGSAHTWSALHDLRSHDEDEEKQHLAGTQFLARFCLQSAASKSYQGDVTLHQRLVCLLRVLLDAPNADSLRSLRLEEGLLANLIDVVEQGDQLLQIDYLEALSKALTIRESDVVSQDDPSSTVASGPLQKMPIITQLTVDIERTPPLRLFECIKLGIRSPSTQQYLDHWIRFLTHVLDLYSQAMFSEMIPLVEALCSQINDVYGRIQFMTSNLVAANLQSPISSIPGLLRGLELVLANAHNTLATSNVEQPSSRPAPSPQTFFSSGAGMLSPLNNPTKTAKSNSRLTVILCVHDAVRLCFRMWSWASRNSDATSADPTSIATSSANALRLRNRTKKILDQLMSVEGLESLEVLITMWVKVDTVAGSDYTAESVFSILNVLSSSRPRNTMPLALNSLYSRTSIDALEVSKRSSLTCDISALDVVGFLLEYVKSIEDDALDEVWSDCMTFLRDVLSNPMPHRQVLPALLELIALLAEKIDNTNFGELQRMHRELADLFSRLLTASFTVRPAAGAYDTNSSKNRTGARTGDLFASLATVTPKLQTILESKDRVLATVNNLTTYIVNPTFHAKVFPDNVTPVLLELIVLMSAQSPDAKLWRREVSDALSDQRFFSSSKDIVRDHWCPILRKWSITEKELVQDLLSRVAAPSSTSLMFGVGANSARTSADRTAQANLRRIAILLLANDSDAFMTAIPTVDAKIAELSTASLTSAPSSATRADIFLLLRGLFLTTSDVHLAPLWPSISSILGPALLAAIADSQDSETYSNLALLQACKLLDVLIALQPDDFQLQEWTYISSTVNSVHDGGPVGASAIVDEVAEALVSLNTSSSGEFEKPSSATDTSMGPSYSMEVPSAPAAKRRPWLAGLHIDAADVKAMAKTDFVKHTLMPFFANLSIASYEADYQMLSVDMEACREDLLADLMDESTIV